VNVIVTTGPEFDMSLLGPVRTAVFGAPFLPQAAVLPHCTAVVSHAGAGTLLGALCHGLPQLCLPQGQTNPTTPKRSSPPARHSLFSRARSLRML
jgi:UDP:flavonoid glycosyltransferase YjiC (YdhE family)